MKITDKLEVVKRHTLPQINHFVVSGTKYIVGKQNTHFVHFALGRVQQKLFSSGGFLNYLTINSYNSFLTN